MALITLVEATPYDPVGTAETTVRYSTGRTDGRPPYYNSAVWDARLLAGVSNSSRIFDGSFGGGSRQIGQIVLGNGDGALDALLGYYWDGRDVTVYRGEETAAFGSFSTVFKGTARGITWDRGRITVTLSDYRDVLEKPVQTTLYAGTGGAEGGTELEGRTKPLAFGAPRNVEPVLVNAAFLVYQFHSRDAEAVDAVYDRAVALTASDDYASYAALIAATVSPGSYATCLAEGLIRLGATPLGPVTADVQGDNDGAFVQTAADVIEQIAEDFTDLVSGDLDSGSFTALNTANNDTLSRYIAAGENITPAQLFDEIMRSVGGFWTFTAARKLRVAQFAFGTSVLTLDQTDLLDDIQRIDTQPPTWRRRMGYAPAWRVQGAGEIAGYPEGSLGIKINFEDLDVAQLGAAFIHRFDTAGEPEDANGYYRYAGETFSVARAQFSDGSTLHTSQAAEGYVVHETVPGDVSVEDEFDDTAGTELASHTPDTGTGWTLLGSSTPQVEIQSGGTIALDASSPVSSSPFYEADDAPSVPEMTTEATITVFSANSVGSFCVLGRIQSSTTFYGFEVFGDGGCRLSRRVSGTNATLASGKTIPQIAGIQVRLTCVDDVISGWYKLPGATAWTLVYQATDSNISSAGNGGLGFGDVFLGSYENANDWRIEAFRCASLDGRFTVDSEEVNLAFCRLNGSQWQYDNGAGWTNLTATASMLVIGKMTTDGSMIVSGAMTMPEPLNAAPTVKDIYTRLSFVQARFRYIENDDSGVQTKHLLARETEVPTLLDVEADAVTENGRQFTLLKSYRDTYAAPVKTSLVEDNSLKLGDTVTIDLPRFGLSGGQDFIIIGMDVSGTTDRTLLTLWG